MPRPLSIFALCLLLAACVPQPASTNPDQTGSAAHPAAFVGDWVDGQGTYFSLDGDGVLGMPGQTARSGLTWSVLGDVLQLRTLDMPGGTPREDRLGIVQPGSSRLELRAANGQPVVWRKSRDAVRRLDGTLFYRERMALPPQVIVNAQLFLPGSDVPFASSLAQVSGQIPLPFRLHYLAKDAGDAANGILKASILYENDSLFATADAVSVVLNGKPDVLLQRTMPGEAAPEALSTPAQFHGQSKGPDGVTDITLYLEPDGLYLLHMKHDGKALSDEVRAGSWKQIERNHTVQLSRGESEPLAAAVRPAGSLLLETIDAPQGEMELKPAVLPLPEHSFRVAGMFRLENERGALTECSSGLDFAVRTSGADYPALDAAYRKAVKAGEPLLVEVEGTVRYRKGAPAPSSTPSPAKNGAEDIHVLEITRFVTAQPGKVCSEPYASSPLQNTYWRLMSLAGKPAQAFPDQSEPHLILRDKHQAVGSDGCNNFFMQWKSTGNAISFELGGSTLMMCPQGNEQAGEMMRTLPLTDSWSITGSVLELRKAGKPLASFEAVSL